MILKVAGSNPAIHPIFIIYKFQQVKNLLYKCYSPSMRGVWCSKLTLPSSIKCLSNIYELGGYEIQNIQKTTIGVFSYPCQQIYFSISIDRLYTYSTGLVLRALKITSRSIRRQNAGYRVYFLFLMKKLQLVEDGRSCTVLVNSLRAWNILKRYYVRFNWSATRGWIILNPTFNFRELGRKKLTSIKRRLRKKFIVE